MAYAIVTELKAASMSMGRYQKGPKFIFTVGIDLLCPPELS
jgi:hypothetical protein